MPDRILDQREQGYEAQFARDEEVHFRTIARRDKLFAVWAADHLKLDDAARLELGTAILQIEGWPRHDEALLRFVGNRLEQAGLPLPPIDIARKLSRLEKEARQQVMASIPADSAPP